MLGREFPLCWVMCSPCVGSCVPPELGDMFDILF